MTRGNNTSSEMAYERSVNEIKMVDKESSRTFKKQYFDRFG